MIICEGIDIQAKEFKKLSEKFTLKDVSSPSDATHLLQDAEVFLIGPDIPNPVKEVQLIYAADKHIAVIILTSPSNAKQVKQTIQFSPFIGKNSLVVIINPEVDLSTVCVNAATRTRQKRSFFKLKINEETITAPIKKVKLVEMGTFLEYAPIIAILVNDINRIVNFNQQAKKFYQTLIFVDVELSSLFPNKEVASIKKFMGDGHTPQTFIEINVSQRVMELTSTEVYDEVGTKHYLLIFNDVTNQRLETKRIQAILDALPQMAWTTDTHGEVTYFTRAWYFYTGQKPEAALGFGWLSAVFPDDKERLTHYWNISVQTGNPFQQAARYKNTNGDYRWHLARASVIRDEAGQIKMWVGTCTDIHDQILLTEELERKVKERTHSLEVSNSELEQFAHVSSHDLQEPLRKIRTFADLLKVNVYADIDDDYKIYLDKISTTAERMSASLKALLNFTRLKKEEKFTSVDLNEIIRQVLVDLELMITQKNAKVDVGTLPVINAVPIQMQQLFYNLINNALKFSQNNQSPSIEISSRQLMEEELVRFPHLQHFKVYHEIMVKDNGIGFDQKYAEQIFTIFQRLHPQTKYEGTGIGLSLVKKVVSNHGGDVYVRSQPNEGTTFYIILPG